MNDYPPETIKEASNQLTTVRSDLLASWSCALDAAKYLENTQLAKHPTIKRFIDTYTKKYEELETLLEEAQGIICLKLESEQESQQ